MTRSVPSLPFVVTLLFIALLAPGCSLLRPSKNGPKQVDELLTRIERVHFDCELAEQAAYEALETLESLVAPDFAGDPVLAFTQFEEAVGRSERRAMKLRSSVKPMKAAAQPFFDQWADDLSEFDSMEMRLRSQERLEATMARYESIVATVEPVQEALDDFNRVLRDHVLFLGNDFNAGSVSMVGDDVASLTRRADDLESSFDECLSAAADYVRSAALPGQLDPPPASARVTSDSTAAATVGLRLR